MGFESLGMVATGLGFGAEPNNIIFLKILEYYNKQKFILGTGVYNTKTVVSVISELLEEYGLKKQDIIQDVAGIRIYPTEYFSPKSYETGITTITENTYSIHHFDGSWVDKEGHKSTNERWAFYKKYKEDEYVLKMYKELEKEKRKVCVDDIGLKLLYKIVIKRTIKKIFGGL
jgi:hypothetical protein